MTMMILHDSNLPCKHGFNTPGDSKPHLNACNKIEIDLMQIIMVLHSGYADAGGGVVRMV